MTGVTGYLTHALAAPPIRPCGGPPSPTPGTALFGCYPIID